MKSSKSLSFELDTWNLVDLYMHSVGLTEVSAAAEELLLAGAQAKKVVIK